MGLTIFRREFVVRRFGKEEIVDGYGTAPYKDTVEVLNVQPLSMSELVTLPDGIRRSKNIRAIGQVQIRTADDRAGTLADRIFYNGEWYECTGADIWGNTPVGQTEAVFGLVPPVETGGILLSPANCSEKEEDTETGEET